GQLPHPLGQLLVRRLRRRQLGLVPPQQRLLPRDDLALGEDEADQFVPAGVVQVHHARSINPLPTTVNSYARAVRVEERGAKSTDRGIGAPTVRLKRPWSLLAPRSSLLDPVSSAGGGEGW